MSGLDILRLIQSAPSGLKLVTSAQKALQGDPEALDYLKKEGWAEALDLVRPGAGEIGKQVVGSAKESLSLVQSFVQGGNVIDGEAREVDPWERFVNWLKMQRWGTFVILGPKGQGKSTLALRLGQIWHEQTGFPVEMVMGYPEEMYDFVTTVSTKHFVRDIHAIIDILDPPGKEGEDPVELDPDVIDRKLSRFKRRIIIVDEMSLTVGTSGADAGRLMVRQLMAQARHLDLLICYIGQLAKMLPNDLLNCEAVFVKRPTGKEADTDREDRLTRNLWRNAANEFATVRQFDAWENYSDVRAWAYVDCPDLGTGRGYQGMVPFSRPGSAGAAIEEGEFEEIEA